MTPATRTRAIVVLAAFSAALLIAIALGVGLGAVRVAPGDVISAVGGALAGGDMTVADAVVTQIRLPRVLLAALVGACLATAGVLYQALFRNALADPYILGVSAGAGLGATIMLVLTTGATAWRFGAVPAGAFVGATLTMLLVVRLATRRARVESASLLLAGIAVSYTLAALTSFLMVWYRESMQSVVFWLMGGLTGASWEYVIAVSLMFALGFAVALSDMRGLNVMLLGDDRAGHLGVDVERFKMVVLAAGSLLVAAAVAVAGLIGFVGLMTPHIVRLIIGPDHRLLLPASALAGATLLVLADLVARSILAPVEIPVGIVTALAGGPFFLWLLVRKDARS
jgi:iron complex transport system permease protein